MADYTYDSELVADPFSFQRAANASITVYDADDENETTPLVLKDLTGLPLPNPLASNADAFVPAFIAPSAQVKMVGGGLRVVRASFQGVRDEAIAAKLDAEASKAAAEAAVELAQAPTDAQVDAGVARANIPGQVSAVVPGLVSPLVPSLVADAIAADGTVASAAASAVSTALAGADVLTGDDYRALKPTTDPQFVRAWVDSTNKVALGINDAGEVSAPALKSSRMNGVYQDANPSNVTGYLRAWTDSQGRIALGIRTDGSVEIPALNGGVKPTASGPDILWNGDSLTAQGGGTGQAPSSYLAVSTGRTVYNNGVGGETSSGIAARQGALPYLMLPAGGSIPASGGVVVTFTSSGGGTIWPLLQTSGNPALGRSFVGTLAGVPGTLTITKPSGDSSSHAADDYYTFTRTTAGSSVPVTRPTPFLITFAEDRRGDIQIFQYGRNNFTDPDRVIGDVAASVQHMNRPDKRFLVLGVHNGTGEGSPSTAYTNITSLNTKLLRIYGRRFVDFRRYLIDYGLADAGITPTTDDLADIAADTVPRSLLTDGLHFQIITRQIVANIVQSRLTELGWL